MRLAHSSLTNLIEITPFEMKSNHHGTMFPLQLLPGRSHKRRDYVRQLGGEVHPE